MVVGDCSWLASCCWVVVGGCSWLAMVLDRFVVFFFFGSGTYYFIVVNILLYCNIYIILFY